MYRRGGKRHALKKKKHQAQLSHTERGVCWWAEAVGEGSGGWCKASLKYKHPSDQLSTWLTLVHGHGWARRDSPRRCDHPPVASLPYERDDMRLKHAGGQAIQTTIPDMSSHLMGVPAASKETTETQFPDPFTSLSALAIRMHKYTAHTGRHQEVEQMCA